MPNNQPNNAHEQLRFEEVLVCAPDGEKPVAIVRTLKWMETVLTWTKDEQGRDVEQTLGFLVTVPPRKSLEIYSHICRNLAKHAEPAMLLEAGKTGNSKLLAVWNGHYDGGCPLCNPPKPSGKDNPE